MNTESNQARLDLKKTIIRFIEKLVEESPENSLGLDSGEKAWNLPLVGFSNGRDPLYQFLKKDIGRFYWLPEEAFKEAYPHQSVTGKQLTIISWVIPQTKLTKIEHGKMRELPSERWARSRLFGEDFNNLMRKQIAEKISNDGYPAVAPMLIPTFRREDSEKYGYASSWSERHTAYVAGLGTFGLSDGLITPVGKAIRCGSVIAKMDLEPDVRTYQQHNAYCLFHFDGSCRKCAERCPANAISETGHDKVICHDYIRQVTSPFTEKEYGLKVDNCGLCQVKVPCQSGIPYKIRKKQGMIRQSHPA